MNWYVLQVMTGTERDVCTALRRKGVCARAPAQRMEIRRRGRWQSEDQHLLPGYVFVGAEYTAALFHVVSPVPGVIRWLGLERGEPQALDTREALRWRLDSTETLEPSRVLFRADGTWHVLDETISDEDRRADRICFSGSDSGIQRQSICGDQWKYTLFF